MTSDLKNKGFLIAYMSNLAKKSGGINLAQGTPGFEPPAELIGYLKRNADENYHQYPPGNGNFKLISVLQKKYENYGLIEPDNLLILQGATEGISLVYTYLQLTIGRPFKVLSFDPPYESFKNLPGIFGQEFIVFSFNENGSIDFNKLKSVIESENVRIIFVGSPGNPFGRAFSKEEINILVALSEYLGFYIIFDAVYNELYYAEKLHCPLDMTNERIFYVNSFSKLFSITGWRIGYLFAHSSHMQKIRTIHDYIGLCAPSLFQQAIADYMEHENLGESYINGVRLGLKESYMATKLEMQKLGFFVPESQGGYFLWARLPEKFNDGFSFAINFYENKNVSIVPGIHFSENFSDYIRINIAQKKEELQEGIKRLTEFIINS